MRMFFIFYICFGFSTLGCKEIHDLGDQNCPKTSPASDSSFDPKNTDVAFIAFGDTQFGDELKPKASNSKQATAINHIHSKLWPYDFTHGGTLPRTGQVRGVIMAGDITHNGRDGRGKEVNEYGAFADIYGLCGNKKLHFPIYEGFGNHDYFIWSNVLYGNKKNRFHPVVDTVARRNPRRPGLLHKAPGLDGHYSWEWDDIHFVQLNLAPTNKMPKSKVNGALDPRRALDFLIRDIKLHVKGTQKKVVIISHYGYKHQKDQSNPLGDDWAAGEKGDAFFNAIKGIHVIALIHGHYHSSHVYNWRGIPVFNVGSPYYLNNEGGSFTLFRISKKQLSAAAVKWNADSPEDLIFDRGWSYHRRIPKSQ